MPIASTSAMPSDKPSQGSASPPYRATVRLMGRRWGLLLLYPACTFCLALGPDSARYVALIRLGFVAAAVANCLVFNYVRGFVEPYSAATLVSFTQTHALSVPASIISGFSSLKRGMHFVLSSPFFYLVRSRGSASLLPLGADRELSRMLLYVTGGLLALAWPVAWLAFGPAGLWGSPGGRARADGGSPRQLSPASRPPSPARRGAIWRRRAIRRVGSPIARIGSAIPTLRSPILSFGAAILAPEVRSSASALRSLASEVQFALEAQLPRLGPRPRQRERVADAAQGRRISGSPACQGRTGDGTAGGRR